MTIITIFLQSAALIFFEYLFTQKIYIQYKTLNDGALGKTCKL